MSSASLPLTIAEPQIKSSGSPNLRSKSTTITGASSSAPNGLIKMDGAVIKAVDAEASIKKEKSDAGIVVADGMVPPVCTILAQTSIGPRIVVRSATPLMSSSLSSPLRGLAPRAGVTVAPLRVNRPVSDQPASVINLGAQTLLVGPSVSTAGSPRKTITIFQGGTPSNLTPSSIGFQRAGQQLQLTNTVDRSPSKITVIPMSFAAATRLTGQPLKGTGALSVGQIVALGGGGVTGAGNVTLSTLSSSGVNLKLVQGSPFKVLMRPSTSVCVYILLTDIFAKMIIMWYCIKSVLIF